VHRQTSGPKIRIGAAQQSDLRSAQAMAIGHANKRAIPFIRNDIKEALDFLLGQYLNDTILPPWFFQSCLRFHNPTEWLFCLIFAITNIENIGPWVCAVS
jgi:hypothetical protein